MTDLYWLIHFINQFVATVVIGCANPVNWEHCFPVSDWFVPWLHDAIHLKIDGAYHEEKRRLHKLVNAPNQTGSTVTPGEPSSLSLPD